MCHGIVNLAGGSIERNYYLNCDTVHEIPAHAAVTYEMRISVPLDLRPGTPKFGWELQGAGAWAGAAVQLVS